MQNSSGREADRVVAGLLRRPSHISMAAAIDIRLRFGSHPTADRKIRILNRTQLGALEI